MSALIANPNKSFSSGNYETSDAFFNYINVGTITSWSIELKDYKNESNSVTFYGSFTPKKTSPTKISDYTGTVNRVIKTTSGSVDFDLWHEDVDLSTAWDQLTSINVGTPTYLERRLGSGSIYIGSSQSDDFAYHGGALTVEGGNGNDYISIEYGYKDSMAKTTTQEGRTIIWTVSGMISASSVEGLSLWSGPAGFSSLAPVSINSLRSIDALQYLAANEALQGYGMNEMAALNHYMLWGKAAGLPTTFSASTYTQAHPEVAGVIQGSDRAAAQHYLMWGRPAGWTPTGQRSGGEPEPQMAASLDTILPAAGPSDLQTILAFDRAI